MSPVAWIAIAGGVLVVGFFAWRLLRPGCHHDCSEPRYLTDAHDPFRRWVQGVMALYRGDVGDPAYWDRSCAARQTESWGIHSGQDLFELLVRYRSGETTVAFDKARMIWIARLGQAMGWLTEPESWSWCHEAAGVLRHQYPSWNAVFQDLDQGRLAWYGGEVPGEARARSHADFQFAMTSVLPQIAFR